MDYPEKSCYPVNPRPNSWCLLFPKQRVLGVVVQHIAQLERLKIIFRQNVFLPIKGAATRGGATPLA